MKSLAVLAPAIFLMACHPSPEASPPGERSSIEAPSEPMSRRGESRLSELRTHFSLIAASGRESKGGSYPTRRGGALVPRRAGGGGRSQRAVGWALEWLVKAQRPDGSWSDEVKGEGDGQAALVVEDRVSPTALALLALLAAGNVPYDSPHDETVLRGLAWLLEVQAESGALSRDPVAQARATLALVEAYGMTGSTLLKASAARAMNASNPAMGQTGGRGQIQTTQKLRRATGWRACVLHAARLCGLQEQSETWRSREPSSPEKADGPAGIEAAFSLLTAMTTPTPKSDRPLEGLSRDLSRIIDSIPANEIRTRCSPELLFIGSQALILHGGSPWAAWNKVVKKALTSQQISEGEGRGSWPASSGGPAQPVSRTALLCLTLEVYYRHRLHWR